MNMQGSDEYVDSESNGIIPCSVCGGEEIVFAETTLMLRKPMPQGNDPFQQWTTDSDKIEVGLNVLVCTDCGHTTLYAQNPTKLKHQSMKKPL